MKVKFEFCDNKGKFIDEEVFVDDLYEFLNKFYYFKVFVCLIDVKFERYDFFDFFIEWILLIKNGCLIFLVR